MGLYRFFLIVYPINGQIEAIRRSVTIRSYAKSSVDRSTYCVSLLYTRCVPQMY